MTLESGLEVPTEKIAEICQRYGIQEMAIFGSAARNEMRPDSDLDIMVEFLPGVLHGLEYFTLERELADVFGRRVDLGTRSFIKPHIKRHILKDAHVIYEA